MKTYRAVIVGTGGIAKAHVNAVNYAKERVQIAAVCDIDTERAEAFRSQHDLPKAYADYATMFREEKPDFVLIATPPGLHAEISIAAMEVGAWVMCEKPLCASLAELDKIQEAEARTGSYTACVFQMRYGSAGNHARKLIQDGTLGRPLVALANTLWFRDRAYYAVPWRGKWDTELGGATMSQGIHTMDFLIYLLGEWEEIRAIADAQFHSIEVDDLSLAHVKFANGARASVMNSTTCPRETTNIRIDCEHATIEAEYLYGYKRANWKLTPVVVGASTEPKIDSDESSDSENESPIKAAWDAMTDDVGSIHGAQLAALVKNRDEGARPITSGEEARRTLDFLTSLYKSAFTGQPVTRGSIQPGDPFYIALHGGIAPKRSKG